MIVRVILETCEFDDADDVVVDSIDAFVSVFISKIVGNKTRYGLSSKYISWLIPVHFCNVTILYPSILSARRILVVSKRPSANSRWTVIADPRKESRIYLSSLEC